jgi:tRNA uracil 4-sulfurtransferase
MSCENVSRYLCRFGEMTLKSRPVRREFTRRLVNNIRDALHDLSGRKRIVPGQAYISVECDDSLTTERLSRIFGLTSIADVRTYPFTGLENLLHTGRHIFCSMIQGKSFAVRCRRVGSHPFTSLDVERRLGAQLDGPAIVNLTNPDVTCRVEIRDDEVHFHVDKTIGAGGLPLGSQGRAICLISGGIDSPVAAWYAMKRGLTLDYLFCNLGGPFQRYGPLKTAKHLADQWSFGYRPGFYEMDFTRILSAFESLDHRYRNILLKRFFYRAASLLAGKTGADAFVTGEVVGQVSSQTLSNLRSISAAADTLVLRPLIAMDKTEITDVARKIGTYDISAHVPEFCNVAVKKPKTRSTPDEVRTLEKSLPDDLLDDAVSRMSYAKLKTMPPVKEPENCAIASLPVNAQFVWITLPDDETAPPAKADAVMSALEIRNKLDSIPRSGPVVLDCSRGYLSKDVASYLREIGFESYYLQK